MIPLCLGASGSERASSMHHFAVCAVVQTFWPVTFQLPLVFTARALSEARSDPESGLEKPWHQISSPERIGSR